jgi:hypothetical protein
MTLQHVVLFAYPRDLDEADATEMRRQIEAWPEAIGGIEVLRFGTDITGARTRGHQYLLYMEFADQAALLAYQKHPVHQRFLAWITERDCTPLAFDYALTRQTVFWPELAPDIPEEN